MKPAPDVERPVMCRVWPEGAVRLVDARSGETFDFMASLMGGAGACLWEWMQTVSINEKKKEVAVSGFAIKGAQGVTTQKESKIQVSFVEAEKIVAELEQRALTSSSGLLR